MGPDCTIRRGQNGWQYRLDGEWHGPYGTALEAASAAEAAAKARGDLDTIQVLWFRLDS